MGALQVISEFTPQGDQPRAIAELAEGLKGGLAFQTLLGATGTGKTYTMSQVMAAVDRSALVLAPNKILAAQLAAEFKELFPKNAVEYFISYYDYYQPEAYVPQTDLYIEKSATINAEIEKLRHSTTRSLLTRRDVIVVASVSCIYGLGSPEDYEEMNLLLAVGGERGRDAILERLVQMQYERNDLELLPGRFRAKGDVLEIFPAYEDHLLRLDLWGDTLDSITAIDPLTGQVRGQVTSVVIFPAKHYVTPPDRMEAALAAIETELEERIRYFESVGKLLEAQRIKERTLFDLEMLRTMGTCAGVENYSRHLSGRPPDSTPYTLLDYFPEDFITFIDESHISVSQVRGMYNGDRSRKVTLVDYGFRLPSALDNRPLRFEEFLEKVGQVVFVSATPAEYERQVSSRIVQQVIRPTGLVDPEVVVKPTQGQIDDLIFAIKERAGRKERVLITTLTKRMAEDLTEYLAEAGLRVRYMHSEIDALERQAIIRDLRLGHFDVLVGINLLREGLDLPEVSLVAILDADKTGFLRSSRSLIQTIGRAARNVRGQVFLYADTISGAMRDAIDETNRRRQIQLAYNQQHGITPQTVAKRVRNIIRAEVAASTAPEETLAPWDRELATDDLKNAIEVLQAEMWAASEALDFERAAELRDRLRELEAQLAGLTPGVKVPGSERRPAPAKRRRSRF
ncbi:MAG: excinuclease ABC subunit UvrB [Deinococcus sp.]|nr:excinuclease ABC subunit UvrB [Deinococcus sp.]